MQVHRYWNPSLILDPSSLSLVRQIFQILIKHIGAKPCDQQVRFYERNLSWKLPEIEQLQLLSINILDNILVNHFTSIRDVPQGTRKSLLVWLYREIVELMQNEICKSLLLSIRSENLSIVTKSLRIFLNFFSCMKNQIKLQMEQFFLTVTTCILENKKSPYR